MYRVLFSLTLLSLAVSLWPMSAKRREKVDAICRAHRLDCEELKQAVVSVEEKGALPEKWITKAEARKLGWYPGAKLGKIAPGKSIGGDRFGNREKRLPAQRGRLYFEADLSYRGGKRNANRLIYSTDRQIYVTTDHYQSFEQIPE